MKNAHTMHELKGKKHTHTTRTKKNMHRRKRQLGTTTKMWNKKEKRKKPEESAYCSMIFHCVCVLHFITVAKKSYSFMYGFWFICFVRRSHFSGCGKNLVNNRIRFSASMVLMFKFITLKSIDGNEENQSIRMGSINETRCVFVFLVDRMCGETAMEQQQQQWNKNTCTHSILLDRRTDNLYYLNWRYDSQEYQRNMHT